METHTRLPNIISKKRTTCCGIAVWLRLMVLRPVDVMAETTRNRLSA